jgi:hypothetical protein
VMVEPAARLAHCRIAAIGLVTTIRGSGHVYSTLTVKQHDDVRVGSRRPAQGGASCRKARVADRVAVRVAPRRHRISLRCNYQRMRLGVGFRQLRTAGRG